MCLDPELGLGNQPANDQMIEIKPPIQPHERVKPRDVLMLTLKREEVVAITSKQERGVKLSSMHALSLVSSNSEFVELVLGPSSPMIGEPVEKGASFVAQQYKAGLIALRRRANVTGDVPERQTSGDLSPKSPSARGVRPRAAGSTFVPGDVLLVLAPLAQTFPQTEFFPGSGPCPRRRRSGTCCRRCSS
jgi:hypothetical protein